MESKSDKCITCNFCKYDNTGNSPAGLMMVTNYKCDNPESSQYNMIMNSIISNGSILDSRKKNGCDKHSSKQ